MTGLAGFSAHGESRLDDPPADAVGERNGVEIDQQADAATGQAQIGQQLCFVDRQQVFDGLEFEQYLVIHDDVRDIAAIEYGFAIVNRDSCLALERHLGLGQFIAQALFLNAFQQTAAKPAMDANCEADDAVGEFVFLRGLGLHGPQVGSGSVDKALNPRPKRLAGVRHFETQISQISQIKAQMFVHVDRKLRADRSAYFLFLIRALICEICEICVSTFACFLAALACDVPTFASHIATRTSCRLRHQPA
jgi:hypothetical protein